MILASQLLPNWIDTLGWTLLNTLWQGAAAAIILIVILKLVPLRSSQTRYTIACLALALVSCMSVVTFIVLRNSAPDLSLYSENSSSWDPYLTIAPAQPTSSSWFANALSSTIQVLDRNMPVIILVWCLGSIAFSFRLLGGWWFISRLRAESITLQSGWKDELQRMAHTLGIQKAITLAESARITSPMVLGFFKPIVLVPAGMLSGLSTAEIETIFLHELAHIRRHDYLINLVQVFVETIFFFNPFIWIISNIVRREREYCCDDEVIRITGSSHTYAHALAQLEEWKLAKSTFALSLAANKNQLLNRIKRIMEKTGQKYSVKDRFLPAALLIVGLVCASWLTVQKKHDKSVEENISIAQDTSIKKSKSSRTTIITFDENGDAHEQVFEEIDGDGFAWAPTTPLPPHVEIPAIPAVPAVPGFPSFPTFPAFAAPPADVWRISPGFADTIPGGWMKRGQSWEKFSKEFEKKFSEEFSDFYKTHEKDFDQMMKEMELKFKEEFEHGAFHGQLMEAERLHELAQLEAFAADEHRGLAELQMIEAEVLANLADHQAPMIAGLEELSSDLAHLDESFNALHGNVEIFEAELKEMLVKDGYLKKDEKINSIRWSDDVIEVNGKKIKDSDAKRYHEKHEKLFESRFHVPRIE